ncbi:Cd2+/Zn2+-exporting ATPase [Fontibacillus phaseoli]|uniref:Cd(2+)-exporting ATPase n=1 Tax=Fontibacillus phaseoli TaxID=1416533 RepID=A0A369B975_9BACL|nr:cation-translocating P-type ATPase [Fontibacillus phaseoli]RCX18080.1 Cd2+/Zn2+-exporting ATPase [Fontibacillus phaseoli]
MNAKQTSFITAAAGLLLLAASVLHLSGLPGWRQSALLTATVIAGFPIALKAFQALRMRSFSIELLVIVAVIGALYLGEYVESSAVTFLFLFGAFLESRTLEKTTSALKSLIDMAPLEATILMEGEQITIPVQKLTEDDRVIIRSGERVAVDGVIAAGRAAINEAAITGESIPATKSVGDPVFCGTIVDNGFIEVIAEKVGEATAFARMIELVEEAQESKSKTQKFLDRFARVYTPSTVVLSILVFFFTGKLEMAITFLVIACPGALVIGAPVSIISGIGNGARHGVLIKGGEAMESLAKIDVVVFDKTGTLTRGRPEITDIRALSGDADELLRLAAEVETASEHPLGHTIVKEAQKRNLRLEAQPEQTTVTKGRGIRAVNRGHIVAIGNRKEMESEGAFISNENEAYAANREKLGNTVIYIGVDGKLAGMISIADLIRPEAERAIKQLRNAGVQKVIMLTGDNRYAAELVRRQLELDEAHAEMLPEDKAAFVQGLKSVGHRVAMAGDGINDAPAIATADIGLAMGEGGTDISMETADVVLMADRLDQFSHAYSLAKSTVRNMKQNTFLAVGTVALLLSGVLFGKVFLASGMLIHELSVLLVVLNAIRLNRFHTANSAVQQRDAQPAPASVTGQIG